MHSILEIKSLQLPVRIGSTTQERHTPQTNSFHIRIGFTEQPVAETTDHLDHSVCYVNVCNIIKQFTANQEFHLMEKLTYSLLQEIKTSLPSHIYLQVCACKKHPPISQLEEGVSYTCGDQF